MMDEIVIGGSNIPAEEVSRGSQCYIGVPNGAVLCVDETGDGDGSVCAILWHRYSEEGIEITNYEEMLEQLETMYDMINFPQPTTTYRSFTQSGSRNGVHQHIPHDPRRNPYNTERFHTDEVLLGKRGSRASFIIRVQQRQNSSWQGRVTWIERDKTLRFRTIMELVDLIDEAARK